MRIVIIEDERLTALDLADTIAQVAPEAEIVAILASVAEALDFFKRPTKIDLIFSDIELGDGLSFAIFEKTENKIPVIFCTAYQHYSLEAFKTAGIDYVLKPFNKTSIEKTLKKYKTLKKGFQEPVKDFDLLLSSLKHNLLGSDPTVIVHQGEKIIPVKGSEIALFYVGDKQTFAYTFDRKKLSVNKKMDALETEFSTNFFRANRQFLVNRKAVKDASQYFSRKLIVNLNLPFDEKIVVGKLKTTDFVKWLAGG